MQKYKKYVEKQIFLYFNSVLLYFMQRYGKQIYFFVNEDYGFFRSGLSFSTKIMKFLPTFTWG